MKNLHLLPTDKPSRLGRFIDTGKLSLRTDDDIPRGENINIYITSNEEIKEGDWIGYLNLKNWVPVQYLHGDFLGSEKKIILTTDQDLIADGVQAIDDEFLEWFVKNPSCESVVVNFNYKKFRWSELNKSQCYKIIIPQEEPKQETLTYTEAAKKEERIFNSTMMSKQETLEEAAANLADPNLCKTDNWIAGANYQAKRMYSEEDVIELLTARCKHFGTTLTPFRELLLKQDLEWFEQFKKK
jgi:hypothetical protein